MAWDQIADLFQPTVLSGSLLVAVPVALTAGPISFASPCVLPLIPGSVGISVACPVPLLRCS